MNIGKRLRKHQTLNRVSVLCFLQLKMKFILNCKLKEVGEEVSSERSPCGLPEGRSRLKLSRRDFVVN